MPSYRQLASCKPTFSRVGADAAISSVPSFSERTNDLSNGLIWPKGG
jgi:hypothetical protein